MVGRKKKLKKTTIDTKETVPAYIVYSETSLNRSTMDRHGSFRELDNSYNELQWYLMDSRFEPNDIGE